MPPGKKSKRYKPKGPPVKKSKMGKMGKADRSRSSASSSKPMTSSFASTPAPTRAAVVLKVDEHVAPLWYGYLFGLLAVSLLCLLGNPQLPGVQGFALLLSGVALCARPPQTGLGKFFDFSVLALLGCAALAFIPQFYWPDAEWRTQAVESFGINLPSLLSIHPWVSFESFLVLVATIAWFYAALGWQINLKGRRYVFFSLSILFTIFAGFLFGGHYYNLGSVVDHSQAFGFLSDRSQVGALLAVSGVATFAYGIEGLRMRNGMHLCGLVCSSLCVVSMLLGGYALAVLIYAVGTSFWYLMRISARSVPTLFKVIYPLILVGICIFYVSKDTEFQSLQNAMAIDRTEGAPSRLVVYKDALTMVGDAPMTGTGIGTFASVFPQYREQSVSAYPIEHAGSGIFAVLSELGVVGFACIALIVFVYLKSCRGLSLGKGGGYRSTAFAAVITFLVYCLIDMPGSRVGILYFVLLIAAFALPNRENFEYRTMRPMFWRVMGAAFILFGGAWILAGIGGVPLHSSAVIAAHFETAKEDAEAVDYGYAIQNIDRVIAWNPLLAEAYIERATYELKFKSDLDIVDADFQRARFLEPVLGQGLIKEGDIWIDRDRKRAVAAWDEGLRRELVDKDQVYETIMLKGQNDPILLEELLELTKMSSSHRTVAYSYMPRDLFIREINRELIEDPSLQKFTGTELFTVISYWLQYGDLGKVESFVEANSQRIDYSWWLRSLILKEQAKFADALKYVRDGITVPPKLPEVTLDESELIRLNREFAVSPDNMVKGTILMSSHIGEGDLQAALGVADAMLDFEHAPTYLQFWRGHILYELEDYIESWYSYRNYVRLTDTAGILQYLEQ
ncbi:MAG: O-antigen ligase family protein [Opitutaceae bacterium]